MASAISCFQVKSRNGGGQRKGKEWSGWMKSRPVDAPPPLWFFSLLCLMVCFVLVALFHANVGVFAGHPLSPSLHYLFLCSNFCRRNSGTSSKFVPHHTRAICIFRHLLWRTISIPKVLIYLNLGITLDQGFGGCVSNCNYVEFSFLVSIPQCRNHCSCF